MNRNWTMMTMAAGAAAAAAVLLTTQPLAARDGGGRLTDIRPRPTRDFDPGAREGWCSVRLWVDEEVNIFQTGGRVVVETVRGRHPYDAGTECSGPLPQGPMQFRFKGIDGRGEVDLVEEPSRRNGYRSWVRIVDRRAGGEEHHFRIFWRAEGRDTRYGRDDRRGSSDDSWDRENDRVPRRRY